MGSISAQSCKHRINKKGGNAEISAKGKELAPSSAKMRSGKVQNAGCASKNNQSYFSLVAIKKRKQTGILDGNDQ